MTALFCLPLWLLAGAAAMRLDLAGLAGGLVLAALGLVLLRGMTGRFLALALCLTGWFAVSAAGGSLLAAAAGPVAAILMSGLVAMAATAAAAWIGVEWGRDNARRRPVREWEWVYTGADFARSHPLSQRLGGVRVVAAFIVMHWAGLVALDVARGAGPESWAALALYSVLVAVVLLALVRRHPAAWPLVWFPLALGFPLSLPLIVYWADGTRPNLIYRHRFERLVPERTEAA
jgi:hypothetical protein